MIQALTGLSRKQQYIDFRQYQDKVCVIYGPLLLKEKLPGEFKNVGHLIFFDRPSRTLLHTPSVEIGVDVWNFFPGHSVEVIVLQCMHSIETVKQRARKQKDHRRTAAEAIWYVSLHVVQSYYRLSISLNKGMRPGKSTT